jgi:hypothetical protein
MDSLFDFELKSAVQPYKIQAAQSEADAEAAKAKYLSNQLKFQLEDHEYDRQQKRKADEQRHKYDAVKDLLARNELINELKAQMRALEEEENYSTDPQYIATKAQYEALCAVI